MVKIVIGLLMVVFLLFIYGAIKLAAEADREIDKYNDKENQNEKRN